jgi:molybdopterin-dependent oxidoreductase alpha subunit
MTEKIEPYSGPAGGWGALKAVTIALRGQMNMAHDALALSKMNQPAGFDCPGCAWPDPKHTSSFEFCENGAKALSWESTSKRVTPDFFAGKPVSELLKMSDYELEGMGRLTHPLRYNADTDCYELVEWQTAFDEIGEQLRTYSDPNVLELYTSGRASNEAAFLYQLFGRAFGTNNFPDCSNMCHEPTSVGMPQSIGVGKGTVSLEDFDHCDLLICVGHNPGTNHPRMLTTLREIALRGGRIIAINPMHERGLERFTAPQNPLEMLTDSSTELASEYYNVRIGGDTALLKGVMRLLIEKHDALKAQGQPGLLDEDFISNETINYSALRQDVLSTAWDDIISVSGLTEEQLALIADAYAESKATIISYGLGITQHQHGTQNVQQLVNLLLLKGNMGRLGAGICPLRGHSNVQGNRTVGITEKPSTEMLERLGKRFGFTPPSAFGHAAIESMKAICEGKARALICLGGNFAVAMPEPQTTYAKIRDLDLTVHLGTKLNRSHLLAGRQSFIFPVVGRTEKDEQASGVQSITVEDSMSMVHASRGFLNPPSDQVKSECAIVAGIAKASLPNISIEWEEMIGDYDKIREAIEDVYPEFSDFNARIRQPGGFQLPNAASTRHWKTAAGKATFLTTEGVIENPNSAVSSELVMSTVRSHDQYNTTLYGMNDRYRGVFGRRDVVFISIAQAVKSDVAEGDRVNLIALNPDGKLSDRRMDNLEVVFFKMADRSLVTYYPESNHMLTLDSYDPAAGIPAYKSIPVVMQRCDKTEPVSA